MLAIFRDENPNYPAVVTGYMSRETFLAWQHVVNEPKGFSLPEGKLIVKGRIPGWNSIKIIDIMPSGIGFDFLGSDGDEPNEMYYWACSWPDETSYQVYRSNSGNSFLLFTLGKERVDFQGYASQATFANLELAEKVALGEVIL